MSDNEFDQFEAKRLAEDFGMTGVPAEEPRALIVIETEILWYKRQIGGGLLEIGRRLIEAKAQLEHGEWLSWLKNRVDFSEVKAQRLMRLAREYSNPSALTDLGVTKALALLALPESEREAFASERHMVNGEEKNVSEMSTRELNEALKARNEAEEKAAAAEDAVKQLRERLIASDLEVVEANRMAREAQEALEKQQKKAQRLQDALSEANTSAQTAEKEHARLTQELEELKSRPVEVAVQVDEEAAARARAEGEQAGAAEREALREQLKALQAALEEARTSSDGDPDAAAFGVRFNNVQGELNQMLELLTRMRGSGKAELAGNLARAVWAMVEAAGKAMQMAAVE